MKKTAGLWVDHRKAVIAIISEEGEETLEIQSHVEKHSGRVAGARSAATHESQNALADDSHSPQLARIVYHLLSTKEAYTQSVFHKSAEEALRRAQYRLRRQPPNSSTI